MCFLQRLKAVTTSLSTKGESRGMLVKLSSTTQLSSQSGKCFLMSQATGSACTMSPIDEDLMMRIFLLVISTHQNTFASALRESFLPNSTPGWSKGLMP